MYEVVYTVNAKILAILSENRDTKILANLNLAVWSWPIFACVRACTKILAVLNLAI